MTVSLTFTFILIVMICPKSSSNFGNWRSKLYVGTRKGFTLYVCSCDNVPYTDRKFFLNWYSRYPQELVTQSSLLTQRMLVVTVKHVVREGVHWRIRLHLFCEAEHCPACYSATESYTLLLLAYAFNYPSYMFIKLFFFCSFDLSEPSV